MGEERRLPYILAWAHTLGEENVRQETEGRRQTVDLTSLARDSASSGITMGLQIALEHRELAVEALSQFANAYGREAIAAMRQGLDGMLGEARKLGWGG